MKAKEQAVRDAARALSSAIVEARAAGFEITWPKRAEDLTSITISETGKVAAAAPTSTAATSKKL